MAKLPYAALEEVSAAGYRREAESFIASCSTNGYALLPVSWQAIAHHLFTKFEAGRTTRSNAGIVSKIKWYYVSVLDSDWLSIRDSRLLSQARKTLAKHEFSIVRKSKPLYGWILKEVWIRGLPTGARQKGIFALWVLTYALMARSGEVLGIAAVRFQQLLLLEGASGRERAYVFHHDIAPKANKLREAQYATVSERASPFCFAIIHSHVQRRRTAGIRVSPKDLVFPAVSIKGSVSYKYSFNKGEIIKELQRWLACLKIPNPKAYTGHCARRGRYNDVKLSVPVDIITSQAHWAPGSLTGQRDYSHASFDERRNWF